MQTLFFPFYPNNPYQPNLVRELSALGYMVDGQNEISPRALFKSLCRGYKIYHLHWTDPYIMSERLPISILKSSFFIVFLILIKLKGSRLVWTIHNFGKHEKSQQRFELFVHRIIAKLSNGIIAHSKFAKRIVTEKYSVEKQPDKIHVIPHGSYIGNYPETTTHEQARRANNITEEKVAFLFLGQIRQYKGVHELMESFAQVSSEKEMLIVAGRPFDQQLEENLAQLANRSTNIQFHPGFVAEEKIQGYMEAADAVVFPFKDILTSGSILLAMSFGKAIIVPKLESLEEIIAVGGAICFDPEDPDGLKSALKAALTSDLEGLGQINLNAAQLLSWDQIARQTADVYATA